MAPPTCPKPWGPRLSLPELTSPFPQVLDVAPELLRICSLILADNRIPPGEVTTVTAEGRGKWGRRAAGPRPSSAPSLTRHQGGAAAAPDLPGQTARRQLPRGPGLTAR